MAKKVVKMDLSFIEAGDVVGKIVNVYASYANALLHTATGLSTVYVVDPMNGSVGVELPQTAKTAGPTVDINGKLLFAVDDGDYGAVYWLMSNAGRFGGPMKVAVTQEDWTPTT